MPKLKLGSDANRTPVSSARASDSPPVVYDITRLVTRALNPTPNGIDRVDFSLARHFLSRRSDRNAALIATVLGPRIVSAAAASRTIFDIETYWNESGDPTRDPVYEAVVRALGCDVAPAAGAIRIGRSLGADGVAENWRAMRRWAFRWGKSPSDVALHSIYFNASQFLLDKPWFLRWLERRPDVKPVFFVHDLLPIDRPEFFRSAEPAQHLRRMLNIRRYAAGVLVGSRAVACRVRSFAARNGRDDLPVRVARLPVSSVFEAPVAPDPRLERQSYFVVCGTIEPRKNHLVLLEVWRRLAEAGSESIPKLIIAGKRGWKNENVLDLLDRSLGLGPHVIEAGGLSTPALRNLIGGARALLMPSFAEGFGLPVAEAMAARIPVIASDIEAFREIGGDLIEFVDPLDGVGWLRAVVDYAAPGSTRRADAVARLSRSGALDGAEFLDVVDDFIGGLRDRGVAGR